MGDCSEGSFLILNALEFVTFRGGRWGIDESFHNGPFFRIHSIGFV
jgi:hypothetical protein